MCLLLVAGQDGENHVSNDSELGSSSSFSTKLSTGGAINSAAQQNSPTYPFVMTNIAIEDCHL